MSTFYNRLRGSVIQIGSQLVSSVKGISTPAAGVTVDRSPKEEMLFLHGQVFSIIDTMANASDADSIETDAKLSQTEVRAKLKRIVEILQSDAENWVEALRKGSGGNENDSLTPCIDLFLQMNVVGELCSRAMSDVPRGIMRLTLTALSTLIKNIPYPFLPHQTVHKPLAKLIFVAARYESLVCDVHATISPEEREKYASYQRRIDISLTSLLRNIWRKILENPPSLDYFIVSDRRTSSVDRYYSFDRSRGPKMQIDILSALLPLIHNPKVGYYAQESVLVALNLRDTRVDYFLLFNTSFIFSVVRNLCDDFNAALAYLQKQLTTNPQSMMPPYLSPFFSLHSMHGATSNPLAQVTTNTNNKSGLTPVSSLTSIASAATKQNLFGFFPAESTKEMTQRVSQELQSARLRAHGKDSDMVNVLCSFISSLVFLRAVFSALADREKISSDDDKDDADANLSAGGLGSPTALRRAACQSRHRISFTFYSEFLLGYLQPALENTNEVQSSAVYILLKLLISYLSTNDPGLDSSEAVVDCNRRKEFAAFEQNESAFFPERMTEMSLLSETLHFLLHDEGYLRDKEKGFPNVYYSMLTDRSSSLSKSLSLSSNLLLYSVIKSSPPVIGLYLSQHVQHEKEADVAIIEVPGLPFDGSMTFDEALSRSCTAIELEFKQTTNNPTPASSSSTSTANNLPAFMQRYVQSSTKHLLQKIFHRGDGLIYLFLGAQVDERQSNSSINKLLDSIVISKSANADKLLLRVIKRLQSYANIRIDEQIALSGLITELCCLMCLSMLLLGREPSTQSSATEQLQQYHLLLKKLSLLRNEINNIVKQVQDVRKKMMMFREYLVEEALSYMENVSETVDPSHHTQHSQQSAGAVNSPAPATPVQVMSTKLAALNHRRKIVESETMQNKHILTSALILQEMQQEVQSYLFALKSLRRVFKDHQRQRHATQDAEELRQNESQRVDEDEFQEDRDDVIAAQTLLNSTLPESGNGEQFEQMFIQEYKLMEGAIEALNGQTAGDGAILVA